MNREVVQQPGPFISGVAAINNAARRQAIGWRLGAGHKSFRQPWIGRLEEYNGPRTSTDGKRDVRWVSQYLHNGKMIVWLDPAIDDVQRKWIQSLDCHERQVLDLIPLFLVRDARQLGSQSLRLPNVFRLKLAVACKEGVAAPIRAGR